MPLQHFTLTLARPQCLVLPIASTSLDKRWLATADEGDDASLIIWDTTNGIPVRTYFQDQIGHGITAAVFSHDAMYLMTLAKVGDTRYAEACGEHGIMRRQDLKERIRGAPHTTTNALPSAALNHYCVS
jgi:hypothetical protein